MHVKLLDSKTKTTTGNVKNRGWGHYRSRVYLPCHMLAKSYYYDKDNHSFIYT